MMASLTRDVCDAQAVSRICHIRMSLKMYVAQRIFNLERFKFLLPVIGPHWLVVNGNSPEGSVRQILGLLLML
jgi:hypothetical protein